MLEALALSVAHSAPPLRASAHARARELGEPATDDDELLADNEELRAEVDELVAELVPTKLRLAHAEDEKAVMLGELHRLSAQLATARSEVEQLRQAAASRVGNFGLFAGRPR